MLKKVWLTCQQTWQKIIAWYLADWPLLTLLILIVTAGAVARFYQLGETFMFEGDQARDILLVRERILTHRPIAIGPVTSVGNMYLGPFYYYFMIPFVFLGNFAPVAPVVGVALMSLLTIILLYLLGKKIVGKRAAIIASFLFAFSTAAVTYARFSWNPNLSPLFGLLTFYLIFRFAHGSRRALIWLGLIGGLLIQLHYVNLIMLGVAGLVWLWSLKKNFKVKNFWLATLMAALLFGATLIPQLAFDFKNRGLNSQAGVEMFTGDNHNFFQGSFSETLATSFKEMWGKTAHVVADLIIPKIDIGAIYYLKIVVSVALLIIFVLLIKREKNSALKTAGNLILFSILMTIIGIAFYQHTIFDHYILFILPLICYFFAYLLARLSRLNLFGKIITAFLLIAFVIYNVANYNFNPQSPTMAEKEQLAAYFIKQAGGQPYNIMRLPDDVEQGTGGDMYALKYRYFTALLGAPPVEIGDYDEVKTLFIIDDSLPADFSEIIDSHMYELQIFGVENLVAFERPIPNGPVIYKLVK